MTTQLINVPVGAPQRVLMNQPGGLGSALILPAATGTAFLEYSLDGVNFIPAAEGARAAPYALGSTDAPGQFTVVRATALTAAALLAVSDVTQVRGPNFDRTVLLENGVDYTQGAITTEANLFALRIPAGVLLPNFRLEVDMFYSLAGAGGTKTFKGYFGNKGAGTSAYAPTAVASGTANGRIHLDIVGRNDGASVNCNGTIIAAAAIASTQAQIASNCAYQTAEQELYFTGTKASGADTLTVNSVVVRLFQ